MNNLQKLIKLRGLTLRDIAEDIDHGYHHVQKVIKGTRYKRRDGSFGTYSNLTIQQAVAASLGLTYEQAWGAGSHPVLRRLILKEIKDQAKKRERDLQQQFLSNNRIPKKQTSGNV